MIQKLPEDLFPFVIDVPGKGKIIVTAVALNMDENETVSGVSFESTYDRESFSQDEVSSVLESVFRRSGTDGLQILR